jgi:5-methylcytosine-specific restriction endonuclease McrA
MKPAKKNENHFRHSKKMEDNKNLLTEKKADLAKLIDEKKKLETKLADNSKKLKKLEKEVKELEITVANEEQAIKEEIDRAMRAEIEKRVREEMEIKKKVEEEMNRIQSSSTTSTTDEEDKKKKEKKDPKRKSIPKAVKTSLWNIHIGEDKAKGDCSVCKSEIKVTNFEAGHIISHAKGGEDNIDNLLPICSLCNKSMGTENLIDYKIKYYNKVKKD